MVAPEDHVIAKLLSLRMRRPPFRADSFLFGTARGWQASLDCSRFFLQHLRNTLAVAACRHDLLLVAYILGCHLALHAGEDLVAYGAVVAFTSSSPANHPYSSPKSQHFHE